MTLGQSMLIISGSAASMARFRMPLLTELIRRGHRVYIVTPIDEPEWMEKLRQTGATLLPLGLNRTGLNPCADLAALFRLRRIIREVNPDVILAYAHKPVLYGLVVAGGRPFYGMLTGLGYVFTGSGLKRRLIRAAFRCVYPLALRRAKALLFLNPDDAATFRSQGLIPPSLPVRIIPGEGVDTGRFAPAPSPAGPVKFLMLARLLRDKGVAEYAEAARIVKAAHPEVEFHLAGAPDTNPTAIPLETVKGWAAAGLLTYHGEVADVRPLLRDCAVYVLPSYREGMPVSILEAMSMERPVIATDVPGCRTAVQPGVTGMLVPVRDAKALADAMIRLIRSPQERLAMGVAARRRVESEFSVERVNRQLFETLGIV